MLLGDQREDLFAFGQGRFASVHQHVAASKSRDLSHPALVVLPVQHDFVVVEGHSAIIGLGWVGRRRAGARHPWAAAASAGRAPAA